MLQFLARRTAESNAFSIRNALWSRAEDDLLVQAVAKHSTSEALFRDWSEVAWELPGRSEQQCIERYRLADTVVTLTFVFLRVTFRGSPSLRSSHVLTNDADSADSARETRDLVKHGSHKRTSVNMKVRSVDVKRVWDCMLCGSVREEGGDVKGSVSETSSRPSYCLIHA